MKALPKRLLGAALPLALAAGVAGALPAAAQDAAKPNILLIVGDDIGYGDLGPYLGGGEPRHADAQFRSARRRKA